MARQSAYGFIWPLVNFLFLCLYSFLNLQILGELNPPQPSFNDSTADNSFFCRIYGQESAKYL